MTAAEGFPEPGSVDAVGVGTERRPLADGLVLTVFGRPVTQGSKTRTRWGMRDDNGDRLRPWREAVKQAALDAMGVRAEHTPGGVGAADGIEGAADCAPPSKGLHSVGTLISSDGGAPDAHPWERLEGPVSVAVVFTFDPPKSAPKSRRVWPITRSSGDLDKLVRAVFDALTDAGVWRDDSQVVRLTASKAHVGDPWSLHIPGACVTVRAVGP